MHTNYNANTHKSNQSGANTNKSNQSGMQEPALIYSTNNIMAKSRCGGPLDLEQWAQWATGEVKRG